MFLKNKYFLIYLLFIFWNPISSIKFYEGDKSVQYDCNVQFEPSREFTCSCISGVWKIYKTECEEIRNIGGLNYCFELPPGDSVMRAEKILGGPQDISVRYQNGSLLSVKEGISTSLDSTEIFTTGADWSITDSSGVSSCFSPTADNFCQFSLPTPTTQGKFTKGCLPSSTKMSPKNCEYFQKPNDNICENSKQAGRVFLIAPGMNDSTVILNDPTAIDVNDEDFFDKAVVAESRDEILTEIWNFIDEKLDGILHIKRSRSRPPPVSNYSSVPLFHILQMATEVMKATCPKFYVKPQFFDMAVYTFIELQKKAFKPEDYPTEYFGYLRIISALKNCSENTPVYPFVNNFSCEENGEPVGAYINMLNGSSEVNVAASTLPEKREPIIETVWKIFFNAHSTCYKYFDSSYNDHHRFTTWITPLFQNDINDVWTNDTFNDMSKKPIVFGNMFGKMMDVQTRITYCTSYAQLDTEYPWQLPIPPKMQPYDPTYVLAPKSRRKRFVGDADGGQCIAPIKLPKC